MQHGRGTHFSSWINYVSTMLLAVASFFTLGGCNLPAGLFDPTPSPGSYLTQEQIEQLKADGTPANLSTASPAEKILDGVAKGAVTGATITGAAAPAAGPWTPTLLAISTALSAVASIASYLRDRLQAKSTQQEREKS